MKTHILLLLATSLVLALPLFAHAQVTDIPPLTTYPTDTIKSTAPGAGEGMTVIGPYNPASTNVTTVFGQVAFIDGADIYINKGQRDAVTVGLKVEIRREVVGDPRFTTTTTRREIVLAQAEVARIQSAGLSVIHVTALNNNAVIQPDDLVYLAQYNVPQPPNQTTVSPELIAAVRQLILTDLAVQDALRGPAGPRGPQGIPGMDGTSIAGPSGRLIQGPMGPAGPQGLIPS